MTFDRLELTEETLAIIKEAQDAVRLLDEATDEVKRKVIMPLRALLGEENPHDDPHT